MVPGFYTVNAGIAPEEAVAIVLGDVVVGKFLFRIPRVVIGINPD